MESPSVRRVLKDSEVLRVRLLLPAQKKRDKSFYENFLRLVFQRIKVWEKKNPKPSLLNFKDRRDWHKERDLVEKRAREEAQLQIKLLNPNVEFIDQIQSFCSHPDEIIKDDGRGLIFKYCPDCRASRSYISGSWGGF